MSATPSKRKLTLVLIALATLCVFEGIICLFFVINNPSHLHAVDAERDCFTIGEIHAAFNENSGENVQTLYKMLANQDHATLNDLILQIDANGGTYDAAKIHSHVVGNKTADQDLRVLFGGLQWDIVYLSKNQNGDPVMTLYLANRLVNANWSLDKTERTYDESWIRTGILHRNETITKLLTAVNEALVTPAEMAWQQTDLAPTWLQDLVWLPSITEVGNLEQPGIWQLNELHRKSCQNCWLRDAIELTSEQGVRPAIHVNLRAMTVAPWVNTVIDTVVYNGLNQIDIIKNQDWFDAETMEINRTSIVKAGEHAIQITQGTTTVPVILQITPKPVTAVFNTVAGNIIPEATLQGVIVPDDVGLTVTYKYNNEALETVPTNESPVGFYEMQVGLNGIDMANYELVGAQEHQFRIVVAVYDFDVTYNGLVYNTNKIRELAPWYRQGMVVASPETIRNVGSFPVAVTQCGETQTVSLNVLPKQLTVDLSLGGWTIGEAINLPRAGALENIFTDDDVACLVSYYDDHHNLIAEEDFENAVPGIYTVQLTLVGDDANNYQLVGNFTQEFIIMPMPSSLPTITLSTPKLTNNRAFYIWVGILGGMAIVVVFYLIGRKIFRTQPVTATTKSVMSVNPVTSATPVAPVNPETFATTTSDSGLNHD